MRSILQHNDRICYVTGSPETHRHEIFFGEKHRQLSLEHGLYVFLHPLLHNMSELGVHRDILFDLLLKREAQIKFMEMHPDNPELFFELFSRDYVEVADEYVRGSHGPVVRFKTLAQYLPYLRAKYAQKRF